MKKFMKFLIPLYVVVIGAMYYVMLPPMNWHSPEFWQFMVFTIGPILVILIFLSLTKRDIQLDGTTILEKLLRQPKTQQKQVHLSKEDQMWSRVLKVTIALLAILILFPTITTLVSSRIFNAKEYSNRIKMEQVDFKEIPEVDFNKTPIIDRDSSIRLGDKVMGNMSEWVSQFNVSTEYTQVSFKDSVYRVTPLTYNGFIKYFRNKDGGIPAYITVDSTDGKTSLVKLKDLGLDGMKYVPSSYFNKNLNRHLRFAYPTEIFGSPSFEIDEKGRPWYICSTYTYKGVGNKKRVTGAIFLDPITGKSKKYDTGNIPSWADRVFPEDLIVEELDDNGQLKDGYWNSIFGQNGVMQTSEGYNYLEKDGDIWLYTGITSANSDESNVGFALVNLRTHEAMNIKTAGANEVSAMKSAESQVKNYGYTSTFPLLINIKGNPVYLMSLKDNGLIKMYATVSAVDYQKVATVYSDEGLEPLTKKTLNVLGTSGENVSDESLKKVDVVVSEVQRLLVDGNTIYYIKADDGNIFKMDFATKYENELAFLKAGDILKITYVDTDGIKTIKTIK